MRLGRVPEEELKSIASDIAEKVLYQAQRSICEDINENGYNFFEDAEEIKKRLDIIFNDITSDLKDREHVIKLTGFKHSVNIVFHNSIDGESNFLFTGDVTSKDMGLIQNNFDNNIELNMHQEYKYIKVPHHGTKAHFFDFSAYNPGYMLIPNGKISRNSYKITAEYPSAHKVDCQQ